MHEFDLTTVHLGYVVDIFAQWWVLVLVSLYMTAFWATAASL